MGDSLSAAYGIDEKYSWVSLLTTRLQKQSESWNVINLSASGDTTSNGVPKLEVYLSTHQPTIVIIELGANDGLRGLPLKTMQHNLDRMIDFSRKKSAKVLLLATQLPPNYGPNFLKKFNQVYLELAKKHKLLLVPMMLKGIAGDSTLMQTDGLHPNQNAQEKIVENIWPTLKQML